MGVLSGLLRLYLPPCGIATTQVLQQISTHPHCAAPYSTVHQHTPEAVVGSDIDLPNMDKIRNILFSGDTGDTGDVGDNDVGAEGFDEEDVEECHGLNRLTCVMTQLGLACQGLSAFLPCCETHTCNYPT